jgi:hypothetical protein
MATFLASLEKAEVAALSQILKRRPTAESVCAEYWTKLALGELQSRRQRLVSAIWLSESSEDKDSGRSVEIKEVNDLENLINQADSTWKYAQTKQGSVQ